jgi:hypothetical protein
VATYTHTYRFFAPLSNATGHYESIRLAPPFRIERWPKDQIIRTWRIQEGVPKFHIEIRMDSHEIEIEKGYGYVITGKARLSHEESTEGTPALPSHPCRHYKEHP